MVAKSEHATPLIPQPSIRHNPRLFACECNHYEFVYSATTAKFLFIIAANVIYFFRECRQGFSFRFRSASLEQGNGLDMSHHFHLQLDVKL
jgi:hypothetical protein